MLHESFKTLIDMDQLNKTAYSTTNHLYNSIKRDHIPHSLEVVKFNINSQYMSSSSSSEVQNSKGKENFRPRRLSKVRGDCGETPMKEERNES
jgi:hypothetical protein